MHSRPSADFSKSHAAQRRLHGRHRHRHQQRAQGGILTSSSYDANNNLIAVFGFTRISGSYPAANPSTHTVAAGETLASIAKSVFGDSTLWYLIADTNGLAGDRDLRVDSDVLVWLKSQGKGYQTRLNVILREAMLKEVTKP